MPYWSDQGEHMSRHTCMMGTSLVYDKIQYTALYIEVPGGRMFIFWDPRTANTKKRKHLKKKLKTMRYNRVTVESLWLSDHSYRSIYVFQCHLSYEKKTSFLEERFGVLYYSGRGKIFHCHPRLSLPLLLFPLYLFNLTILLSLA